jgi:hypothetical protein
MVNIFLGSHIMSNPTYLDLIFVRENIGVFLIQSLQDILCYLKMSSSKNYHQKNIDFQINLLSITLLYGTVFNLISNYIDVI